MVGGAGWGYGRWPCGDKQTSGCEDHMRACVQAGGRDDNGCARGHFVQATAHLRKPPARPAFGKFSHVCARRRTASAQQL